LSTVLENKPAARGGVTDKLAFFNGLRSVTNTIHSTTQIDEIILDLGRDICSLFGADRLTITWRATTASRSSPRSRPASTRTRTSSCP
jgi:hypothetical protein